MRSLLRGKLTKKEARATLACGRTTLYRYILQATEHGIESVVDKRRGNNRKLSARQEKDLVDIKENGRWRSARKAIELTGIATVGIRQIQKIWVKHNLHRENIERLKPLVRFVAKYPNELWQADIQGKMRLPHIGEAYLILVIDDHSRFILGGKWFSQQTQMNVFRVWYHCLFVWGLPRKMLQDKGSQYKANARYGQSGEYAQSTYQFYAKTLGIELIFAHKAQTKGKVERFFRFIQRDFVRENMDVRSFEELNKRFFVWQIKYNEEFVHSGIGMNGRAPAEVYQPSEKRKPKQELQELLTITIRRLVYRDSSISLFGKRYKVPNEFITARIWVKIKGETVRVESMGRVVYKFRLRA
ncbi:MAG: DDE-type integrase/transposase/recombinase [Nanoarchaeota archaeon]